ncbi:hypothetical protein [Bifidobacterium bifidum]|uniref:hypothetical protein n=1 Tax=Bifidobacterium bifidum TaxID=1681 RepID=UPI003CFF5D8A
MYDEARSMLETGRIPDSLKAGLEEIEPYTEPKHRCSTYDAMDPNNLNSIAYLMRHLYPDEIANDLKRI